MAATLQTRRSGATQHPEEMFSFVENRDILASGVGSFDNNHFLVEESDTPALSVDIRDDGVAWIVNSDNTVTYPVRLYDGDETLSITANSSGNDRIDAVVLYIDLGASPNTTATNVAKFAVVEGTPAATPAAPDDSAITTDIGASNPYLRLANVLVQDSASAINDADITDTRVDAKRNHSLSREVGGWTPLGQGLTYASATTVTTDSDISDELSVGMKLKLTQPTDGVKYFYITGISGTTLTITGGDDYDMDNEDIWQPYISVEESPVGFPQWFDWSTGISFGGFSSLTQEIARFQINGRLVTLIARAVGTSNSTATAATLPIGSANVAANHRYQVCTRYQDNGTVSSSPGSAEITNNTSTINFYTDLNSGAWTGSGTKGVFDPVIQYQI